ncbi:MAG: hypothetical protein M0Z79_00295 [Nitrospiraceae bacterium]|nr:hypothetical protein [Nitrospiraceae bacterium]
MRSLADKKLLVPAVWVSAVILCIVLTMISFSLKREQGVLKAQRNELLALRDDYLNLKGSVAAVEGRKSLSRVEGVIPAVDEIFKSLGLSQKVKSMKAVATKEQRYATEEEADVQVEKVGMNELVNILYKMENAPMILAVKKTIVRTSFDNPSLLNVTMTVSLIRPK